MPLKIGRNAPTFELIYAIFSTSLAIRLANSIELSISFKSSFNAGHYVILRDRASLPLLSLVAKPYEWLPPINLI